MRCKHLPDYPSYPHSTLAVVDQDGDSFEINTNIHKCSIEWDQNYKFLKTVQAGSFARIYEARYLVTNQKVAIKKQMWMRDPSLNPITLNEIKMLVHMQHPNVCRLRSVIVSRDREPVCMALDYYKTDLQTLLLCETYVPCNSDIKCITKQLLEGLKYIHSLKIIHGDFTPPNIMFDSNGIAKIIDFGLAQYENGITKKFKDLCTLWYRSPELLFGVPSYTTSVDLWALGCIVAGMYLSRPLFHGKCEIETVVEIVKILGNPNDECFPDFSKGTFNENFSIEVPNDTSLRQLFVTLTECEYAVIETMVAYNPSARFRVYDVIEDYVTQQPPACKPEELKFLNRNSTMIAPQARRP